MLSGQASFIDENFCHGTQNEQEGPKEREAVQGRPYIIIIINIFFGTEKHWLVDNLCQTIGRILGRRTWKVADHTASSHLVIARPTATGNDDKSQK